MVGEILPFELRKKIELVISKMDPRARTGRLRVPDRDVLRGILFVLKRGIQWEYLPQEMDCGSGMTRWRRLKRWRELGTWEQIHHILLDDLQEAGKLDWSRASLAASNLPAKKRGSQTGPNPTDHGRPGSKHHVIVERHGIPLATQVGPANQHDSKVFEALIDAIPAVRNEQRGRPRRRPGKLHADKEYDFRRCREACRKRGMKHRIARRGVESRERLGIHRWVVERTFA